MLQTLSRLLLGKDNFLKHDVGLRYLSDHMC